MKYKNPHLLVFGAMTVIFLGIFIGWPEGYAQVISARKADSYFIKAVEGQSFLGLEMLKGLRASDPPDVIVNAIDKYLVDLQKRESLPKDAWYDVYTPLGTLWGEQIGYAYGWEWERVWLDEDAGEFSHALVSPNRSMVIYPFRHLKECIETDRFVSVSLVFRSLGQNTKLSELPPGSYTDLLANLALLVMSEEQ